jgi:hypothetical protein
VTLCEFIQTRFIGRQSLFLPRQQKLKCLSFLQTSLFVFRPGPSRPINAPEVSYRIPPKLSPLPWATEGPNKVRYCSRQMLLKDDPIVADLGW